MNCWRERKQEAERKSDCLTIGIGDQLPSSLHIPAGILRIPVFSVLITCFSQESQFLFRRNLVFWNKKEQKPSQ